MQETNSTLNYFLTPAKYSKYVVTDSITKSFLIDGLTTFLYFSIPHVPFLGKILTANVPVMAFSTISKISLAFSLGAVPSYIVRSHLRDNDNEYQGGIIGGAIKYNFREVILSKIDADSKIPDTLLYKSLVGSANNFEYEFCSNSNICSNNIAVNILYTMFVEGFESFYTSKAGEGLVNSLAGATAGFMASMIGNFLYSPCANWMRKAYDLSEEVIEINLPNFNSESVFEIFANGLNYTQNFVGEMYNKSLAIEL